MSMSKALKNKTLNDLEINDCRWPIGDPRQADFHFCGAPQQSGRPYCAAHWAMSFEASKTRQREVVRPQLVLRAA